jgi:transcriptional regulator with XRE-family HTH domain
MATHLSDAAEKVRYLRGSTGLTESDLAAGTGASTRTVRRWTRQESDPQPRYERQIDDLSTIVAILEVTLTPKGIQQWLRSRNRTLDGKRPIELLKESEFERVKDAACAFEQGYYV